jgi:hypothetical protein
LTAVATASLVGTSRNTVKRYFSEIRQRVFQLSLQESSREPGAFELNESYFGAKRICGKRGRGAAGKTLFMDTNIIGCSVARTNSPEENCTLTELNPFSVMQNIDPQSFTLSFFRQYQAQRQRCLIPYRLPNGQTCLTYCTLFPKIRKRTFLRCTEHR